MSVVGFDYVDCHDVADTIGIGWAEHFDLFQALEREYLKFLDERRENDKQEQERKAQTKKKGRRR